MTHVRESTGTRSLAREFGLSTKNPLVRQLRQGPDAGAQATSLQKEEKLDKAAAKIVGAKWSKQPAL